MKSGRTWLFVGAVFGLAAVALGAFGAHGLEKAVADWGLSAEQQTQRLQTWEVGVRYQMYHALALLLVGTLASVRPTAGFQTAAIAWIVGVLIFSGCLYLYVLSGWKTFGMIVPIGGVSLIVGWAALAVASLKIRVETASEKQS
jgi:uncharacterized membrane protein YgdD (TMEM256/DUF423 family)